RHTSFSRDWSSDVCSSDLATADCPALANGVARPQAEAVRCDELGLVAIVGAVAACLDHLGIQVGVTRPDGPGIRDSAGGTQLDKIGRASCRERVSIASGRV